jgi:hypothetical protein
MSDERGTLLMLIVHRSSLIALCLLLAGCGSPSAANIQLRKENQKLNDEIARLARQHDGDVATIRAYESNRPTVPTLPEDRLARLFTAHGLWFARLTGGENWDGKPGDDGLKIGIVPIDQWGDAIKAAGAFKIEAFDLDEPTHPLIGTWQFSQEQSAKVFYNRLTLYTYVFRCPWQTVPRHEHLTVKVTFDDELTSREFVGQCQVAVSLPPSPTPTTNAAAPPVAAATTQP